MELSNLLENFCVDKSKNTISEGDIPVFEELINVKFGEQLRFYILTYGFLAYKYIEFFSISSFRRENSSMVVKSTYLHTNFPITQGLIAFEDVGDGDYYLVDSSDNVFHFQSWDEQLTDEQIKLNDYIIQRFNSIS